MQRANDARRPVECPGGTEGTSAGHWEAKSAIERVFAAVVPCEDGATSGEVHATSDAACLGGDVAAC